MCAYKISILLVVALASSTVNCRQLGHRQWNGPYIPARCVALSVTPVSCAQYTPDSLAPHPDDCELFYYCVSGEAAPICRQCPAQLHFNPHLRVCDYPESAGCSSNSTTVAELSSDHFTESSIDSDNSYDDYDSVRVSP